MYDCSIGFCGGCQCVEYRFIQVVVIYISVNDVIIVCIYQCFSWKIGCVSVVINNVDFWQFIQFRDIEWCVVGMFMCWGMLVVNFIVVNVIQRIVVNRFEGCYVGGVGFGDVMVIKYGVIYYYQYVMVGGGFISCGYYCVIQVEWIVCVYRCGWMYCVDYYYWFVVFYCQVEEVSSFFYCVGIVGNDEVVGFIVVGVNFFCQCQLDIIVYVLGVDIYYLFVFNVCNVFQLWYCINQIFYVNFIYCVVRFGCGVIIIGNGFVGC